MWMYKQRNKTMFDNPSVRFALVGAGVYLFDTSLLWCLSRLAGIELGLATTIAYIAGVLLHFKLTFTFTFANTTASQKRRIIGYAGMLLINYLITLGVVLGMQTYVLDNIVAAKSTAVVVTALTGYFGLRWLALSDRNKMV